MGADKPYFKEDNLSVIENIGLPLCSTACSVQQSTMLHTHTIY
jgi:hypothetical protein